MSFNSGRLSHAYITDDSFADTLAMAVVCEARDTARPCGRCIHCDKASRHIHPDITVVGRLEDKHIVGVDQIRELKKDVFIVPNEAKQKAYIVNDADSMNVNAQNAFLQVLEEPPAHAVFILCTGNPAALLPTVRSRCVELKGSVEADGSGIDENECSELEGLADEFIAALAGDNVKLMEVMFRLDKLDRFAFSGFIDSAREKLVVSLKEGSCSGLQGDGKVLVHAETVLLKAGEMLDLNVSAGHIAGYICASLLI